MPESSRPTGHPADPAPSPTVAHGEAPASDSYRALFDNLPVGVYRSTPGGVIVDANPALLQMLGYPSLEALAGVNMVDLYVDPEDRLRWIAIMERDGVVTDYRVRKRRRDGTVIWLLDTARPARGEDGATVFDGVVVDVTAQHEAEEALRKSERRYRALLEAVPDAILRMSIDGLCLDAAEGISSPIHRADVLRKHVSEIFPAATAELVLQEIPRCVSTGERASFEYTDQAGRLQEIRLSPGGHDDILALIQDVTERKGLGAHLMRSERLASVGVLAGGVAHEINNPLSYVSTNIEFALRALERFSIGLGDVEGRLGAGDGGLVAHLRETLVEAREALAEAAEGEARVRAVVQELKDFSRDQEGAPGRVDLRSNLESSIKLVANEIRSRGVLIHDLEDVGEVVGDASRLGQVFVNLLVNALQALDEDRRGENQVKVVLRGASGGRAMVEVSDTGRGIEPEHLARIFDPFYTTKASGVGAGLGLAVSHNIVDSYGGEITVESTVGVGTTVRVYLPSIENPGRERRTIPPRGPETLRARVLIIDDEPLIGRAFERVLARHHDVRVTTDGLEALAWIEAGARFDAIFCDMMMPGISGIEVYERLREQHPQQAARVAFMTGGAFTPEVADFLDAVDNWNLQKPLSIEQMGEMVSALVRIPWSGEG